MGLLLVLKEFRLYGLKVVLFDYDIFVIIGMIKYICG